MTDEWATHVETRSLGEIAHEEIETARRAGVDPMEIARTHQRLGHLIPEILKKEATDD